MAHSRKSCIQLLQIPRTDLSGCVEDGKRGKVLHLQKELFGLKRAAKVCSIQLLKILSDLGFDESSSDEYVYIRRKSNVNRVWIVAYMVDMLLAGDCEI